MYRAPPCGAKMKMKQRFIAYYRAPPCGAKMKMKQRFIAYYQAHEVGEDEDEATLHRPNKLSLAQLMKLKLHRSASSR